MKMICVIIHYLNDQIKQGHTRIYNNLFLNPLIVAFIFFYIDKWMTDELSTFVHESLI